MAVANQREVPVVYVAGSARELPADVQDWLGRAENRAVASPDVYDMLAQLARGKKFAAMIVNIQSVDWSEMEFFDHAVRLSRQIPIYVTGHHSQRGKLEAACRRGARLFDPLALDEDIAQAAQRISGRRQGPGTGAEDTGVPEPSEPVEKARSMPAESDADWPRFRLAKTPETEWNATRAPEALSGREDPETDSVDDSAGLAGPAAGLDELPEPGVDVHDHATPEADEHRRAITEYSAQEVRPEEPSAEPGDTSAMGRGDQDGMSSVAPDRSDRAAPAGAQTAGADSSDSRATQPSEQSEGKTEQPAVHPGLGESRPEEDEEAPVIFPWSANANRPQRTPPRPAAEQRSSAAGLPQERSESPPESDGSLSDSDLPPPEPDEPSSESPASNWPFRSVHLSDEEIDALMGRPPRRGDPEGSP